MRLWVVDLCITRRVNRGWCIEWIHTNNPLTDTSSAHSSHPFICESECTWHCIQVHLAQSELNIVYITCSNILSYPWEIERKTGWDGERERQNEIRAANVYYNNCKIIIIHIFHFLLLLIIFVFLSTKIYTLRADAANFIIHRRFFLFTSWRV